MQDKPKTVFLATEQDIHTTKVLSQITSFVGHVDEYDVVLDIRVVSD